MENPDLSQNNNPPQPRGFSSGFDANAVIHPQAPAYYSQCSIMVFSVIFSVIFGAVLLILNLKDNKPKWLVALYAVIYTAFSLSFLSIVDANTAVIIAANALGAYLLVTVFWNRYIGRATHYQKKSITKPLIISIIIIIAMAALSI